MTRQVAVAALASASLAGLIGVRLRPRPLRLAALSLSLAGSTPTTAASSRRAQPAGSAPRPVTVRVATRAAIIAVVVGMGGTVAGLLAVAVLLMRPRLDALRLRRRTTAAVASAYPDLVDLLVLTVKSGCSPVQAFATLRGVVPPAVRSAVGEVANQCAAGERFADAVARLQALPPVGLGPIAQPLADALALADRHGTPLGPVLDRLAADAREHRRRQADIAARQLPIRLAFPLVGCTLPSFVLLTIVPLMAGTFSSLRGLAP